VFERSDGLRHRSGSWRGSLCHVTPIGKTRPVTALASAPDPLSSRLSGLSLWLAVRKNWPLVMLMTVILGAGATFYTLGQPKLYDVSATIMFDPQVPKPLGKMGESNDMSSYWNNKEYYKTQQWVIQSMGIASRVVQELELNKDGAFMAGIARSANPPRAAVPVERAAEVLMSRVTVEPIKESRLTVVKYRDADPARAQRILAALVDTYAQENLDTVFEASTVGADWLRTQIGSLRQDLETSEMALHEYKKNKNILSVSMDERSNMLQAEMAQLNAAVTHVRTEREKTAARLAQLRQVSPENPADLPVTELLNNSTLNSYRADYVARDRELSAFLSQGLGENHPSVKATLARREISRAALMNEVKNIQNAAERDRMALDQEASSLQRLFADAEARALDLNLMEIEYTRLRRAKENNEKLFSIVIERSKETDLTRMLRVNNVKVVAHPLLPKAPATPNVPLNIASGIAAGLVLGLAAAIGREQLDRTIKHPDEVENQYGLSLLGVLPQIAADAPLEKRTTLRRQRRKSLPPPADGPLELIVHNRPTSGIAEAARAIRTNIVFMAPDNPHRVLLVTSGAPAEGKTTVACAIAITIAQAGKSVVLVDCDLRRPRLHKVFGQSNDLGMTSALLDPRLEDSIVSATDVPNLSLVVTGPIPPNPAELLHSEAFKSLVAGLKGRFDTVIIDSPPVVPVTDATVLSTLVDGVILVVRSAKTTKELIRRALRSLRDVGGRVVGVVLNGADLEGRGYAGYQYYYYRREGYSSQLPPENQQQPTEHVGSA
jgi:polysaccharide biosynthesis transport protein